MIQSEVSMLVSVSTFFQLLPYKFIQLELLFSTTLLLVQVGLVYSGLLWKVCLLLLQLVSRMIVRLAWLLVSSLGLKKRLLLKKRR